MSGNFESSKECPTAYSGEIGFPSRRFAGRIATVLAVVFRSGLLFTLTSAGIAQNIGTNTDEKRMLNCAG
jgi:hypothetical protein